MRDCLKRNIPKKSSTQVLHFESVDRLGGKRECRGKLLGAQLSDGLRRVKVCITAPADVAGTEFLSIEAPGREPDSLPLPPRGTADHSRHRQRNGRARVRLATSAARTSNAGSSRIAPNALERLPDAEIGGHPVYVVAATPRDRAQSTYTKVVSYVDQKTCVVIKSESFQNGDAPRKVMTADPEQMLEDGGIYAPSDVLVTDLRDGTHTTVNASELEVDGAVDPRSLEPSTLGRHCR